MCVYVFLYFMWTRFVRARRMLAYVSFCLLPPLPLLPSSPPPPAVLLPSSPPPASLPREFMLRHLDRRLREDGGAGEELAASLSTSPVPEDRERRLKQITLFLVDRAVQGLALLVILCQQKQHLSRVVASVAASVERPARVFGITFRCVCVCVCGS